jgi:Pin2-interacting protein X1
LTTQGWKEGSFLGAADAPHAEHHTKANVSHIRVSLKDDNGGIGWRPGASSLEHGGMAGLEDVMDIFARLNGKQETEEERLAKERRKAMRYVGQRVGTMDFIRGGVLVQEELEAFVDEGLRTPVETAEAIREYELDLDVVDGRVERKQKEKEKKKKKKRKADADAGAETEGTGSEDRAERKRRRKEEKGEKRRRKDDERRIWKESAVGGEESDTAQSRGHSAGQTPVTRQGQLQTAKNETGISSSTDSAPDSLLKSKKPKRDRKLGESPIASVVGVDPSLTAPGNLDAAAPRRNQTSTTKSPSKKDRKSKKESRSAPTSQMSTPTATPGTSTPTATGTSTPLGGRHIHHARRVAAKNAGVLDAAALKQVRVCCGKLLDSPRRHPVTPVPNLANTTPLVVGLFYGPLEHQKSRLTPPHMLCSPLSCIRRARG